MSAEPDHADLYSRLWNEERRDRIMGRQERAAAFIRTPDRTFLVPPGHIVKTGYVDVFRVRLACRSRMAVGDVDHAYQRLIRAGSDTPFPCPNGRWIDRESFELHDGRHEYVASVMLGKSHILVAWMEALPTPADAFRDLMR